MKGPFASPQVQSTAGGCLRLWAATLPPPKMPLKQCPPPPASPRLASPAVRRNLCSTQYIHRQCASSPHASDSHHDEAGNPESISLPSMPDLENEQGPDTDMTYTGDHQPK